MIKIKDNIFIDENKINFQAIKSSGPGGQNINKVSTAVILKYYFQKKDYPNWFIDNLRIKAGSKLSKKGYLIIKANSYRSQTRNKKDAIDRLVKLFKLASYTPKLRINTKPNKRSIEKRISNKKINSMKKQLRKNPSINE